MSDGLPSNATLALDDRSYRVVVGLYPDVRGGLSRDYLQANVVDVMTGRVLDSKVVYLENTEGVIDACSCCPLMLDFCLDNFGPRDGGESL